MSQPNASVTDEPIDCELCLTFVDSVLKPIAKLVVEIFTDDSSATLVTDDNGRIPVIAFGPNSVKGTVHATVPTGKKEEVIQFDLQPGFTHLVCQSPYQLVSAPTDIHHGTPGEASTPVPQPPGTIVTTRNLEGHPECRVTVSECEDDCQKLHNLKLGINAKYRAFVLDAAKTAGIAPWAVAALIHAEAAKIRYRVPGAPLLDKHGKPLLDKKGKPRHKKDKWRSDGEWDPKSIPLGKDGKPTSSARGLTQFVNGTWEDLACNHGTFLHGRACAEFKADAIRRNVKKPTVIEMITSGAKTFTKLTTTQRSTLLDLRFDPESSIRSAADYAASNYKAIKAQKTKKEGQLTPEFSLDGLGDYEKAKLLYLMHHEGSPAGTLNILRSTLNEKDAEKLLRTQLSKGTEPDTLYKAEGTWEKAYRRWLFDYIDKNIVAENIVCDKEVLPKPPPNIFDIVLAIGGKHPHGFTSRPTTTTKTTQATPPQKAGDHKKAH